MTSSEFHKEKVLPVRKELQRLEQEYKRLYREECGSKVGGIASCDNCGYSCIINPTDYHNLCMNDQCVCCHDWCYSWIPENNVSKFLRENYHYDNELYDRLKALFGDAFLRDCENNDKLDNIMAALNLIKKFDSKDTDND